MIKKYPFNLQRALAGDPVIRKDGTEIEHVVLHTNEDERYPQNPYEKVMSVAKKGKAISAIQYHSESGKCKDSNKFDLYMATSLNENNKMKKTVNPKVAEIKSLAEQIEKLSGKKIMFKEDPKVLIEQLENITGKKVVLKEETLPPGFKVQTNRAFENLKNYALEKGIAIGKHEENGTAIYHYSYDGEQWKNFQGSFAKFVDFVKSLPFSNETPKFMDESNDPHVKLSIDSALKKPDTLKKLGQQDVNVTLTDGDQEMSLNEDGKGGESLQSGLMVIGRSQIDNKKIQQALDKSDYYAEFNAVENYFFFPEEEHSYDDLERELENLFQGISYHVEGVFN